MTDGREVRAVRRLTRGLVAFMAVQTVVFTLDAAFPPDLTRARSASAVVLDRHGAWLRALPVEDGRWRLRADLDRTDPVFLKRLVAVEDSRFWVHPGVDPAALVRATGSAIVHGGRAPTAGPPPPGPPARPCSPGWSAAAVSTPRPPPRPPPIRCPAAQPSPPAPGTPPANWRATPTRPRPRSSPPSTRRCRPASRRSPTRPPRPRATGRPWPSWWS